MNFSIPLSWQLPSGRGNLLAYSIAIALLTTSILRARNGHLTLSACNVSTCTESKHNHNPSPPSPALPSWAEISHLPDDELFKLFEASEHVITGFETRFSTAIRRIASDAVMKVGSIRESQPTTMRLICDTTPILVPRVLRFFNVGFQKAMVMDYVSGQTLKDCWANLGFWQRLRVIWTIRRYIRQLRCVSVPGIPREKQFPGPIGSEPSMCHGPLFTFYGAGPFAAYDELTAWYMHKLDVNRRVRKTPTEPITFDSSLPLVMSHMDLYPNNVMLDDAGRVWLIDWEFAGFYPQWFEYTMMQHDWEILGRWRYRIVGFMAGFYERQTRFIGCIEWALVTGILL